MIEKSDDQLKNEITLLQNELGLLSAMLLKIQMGMDLDELLDEIIFTIRENIRFDGCNFAFIEEAGYLKIHKLDYSKISRKSNLSKDFLEQVYSKKIDYSSSNDFASITVRENRELYYPEISIDDFHSEQRDFLKNYGITGLYYLPIRIGEKVLGVIRFHNYGESMILSDFEKNLIRRRVAVVAKAIENTMLYREIKNKNSMISLDLELARRIQINFLPHSFPKCAHVDIAAEYIPMIEVGGDYYDFIFEARSNAFGLLITDTSGHGVPAAFVTSMLKMVFQSKDVFQNRDNPATVLQILNSQIYDKIAGNFVTGCYAWFDLDARIVRIASAGHNPVFKIAQGDVPVVSIKPKGKILGVFSGLEFEIAEVSLVRGDRFVFYTDGLVEGKNRDGVMFENELLDLIAKRKASSSRDFLNLVLKSLKDHVLFESKKSFEDDVAIVIVDVI